MIKRFISYYRPHWKLFLLDMICAFSIAVIDLLYPVATRKAINDLIPNGKLRPLLIMCGILAILFIVKFVCNYIVDCWGHIVGVRMEYDMRKELFSHIQNLSFNYFDNNKTGHIMSRIVNDLRDITELAHHGPEDLFISLIMIVGSFFILITIEWRLTLIIFLFIPIMAWFGIIKRRKMLESFRRQRREIANVNSRLENSIAGIRVSKSFTNEEFEMEKFNTGNIAFKDSREGAFKIMAEFSAGIQLFSNTLDVVVLSLGGIFAYNKIISVGDLVAYILYVNYFLQPIKKLAQFIQQYQDGMSGFERFTEVMDIQPDIYDKENALQLENINGKIELKNVTFSYTDSNEKILSNISYTINPGETLALVGPSGGGKTTLCHLIPRFYDVDSGEILIDDINIADIELKSLRQNIGVVQQDVFLFTGTIKENILYGKIDATDEEVVKAAKSANIHDFIMSLPNGYDTYIGEKGAKLSGGQKQRISIARVFLKDPSILILDEATSALDNENEIIIQKSLELLSKGRTTIVIAHRLTTIRNADKIIVLTDEGIMEQGHHKDLMQKDGLYAKLYNSQFREEVFEKMPN
ncbi:ABC transporter, permease/ATP-binding protein [Gottschalkia purinilytica]|uniref:ABC transporter, permease/ATP-binding protein n=1 Tax=Gottschalkia purinilytica TaxID=1503 RepID=A0A0L0W9J5_GOTPU|nr:ABC transporter ATP-binding protein [Gottschalkia purinilytica]KNF08214.1 ABC transporter, permease/ATP-binding protein [Gottschalkia purinilytica]